MKLWKISGYLALAVIAPCLLLSGCGGKTSAIVTSVSVTSSVGSTLILGQSTTITATVTGPSNTDVTWEPGEPANTNCTYTTTTTALRACKPFKPPRFAPPTVPSAPFPTSRPPEPPPSWPRPFSPIRPPILCSPSSSARKPWPTPANTDLGTISLNIDSGITVSLTPTTAAVPTSEKQPFFAILTNDLQNKGVTWSLTQSTPSSTTPTTPNIYAGLVTCTVSGNASGCGSIDANGIYTAPAAVPTDRRLPALHHTR